MLVYSLALVISSSHAFAPGVKPFAVMTKAGQVHSARFMSDGGNEKVTITSGKKEIAYDDKTGRFFETNLDEEECVPNDEYCAVDGSTGKLIRLTVQEKERIFLDALQVRACYLRYYQRNTHLTMSFINQALTIIPSCFWSYYSQSYYATGRQMLKDEEFDILKEDLQWNGSDMVVMNRKEAMYLAAVQAYLMGTPTISDSEFDALKLELKETGSKFAVSTSPKCYIDTGICTVTLQEDKFRSNLLYLPAVIALTSIWLGIGFEIFAFVFRLNPLIFLLIGTPLIYYGSKFITEDLLFPGKCIVYGPCPSCESENRVYFGKILMVDGFTDVAKVKCTNCRTEFNVQRKSLRASTVSKA